MPPKLPDSIDDPDLVELRKRYQYGQDEWAEARDEGRKDIRFLTGRPWEAADLAKRRDAGRPCLVFDELNQYPNQLVNELEINKRGIKVTPVGNGATDDTAAYHQGRIRQIEYRSNGQQAYIAMFENAVTRGYGFCEIEPRYVDVLDEDGYPSLDQELWIVRHPNPDTITLDPDALDQSGRDAEWAFKAEKWTKEKFKRKFKKAKVIDFDMKALPNDALPWVGSDHVIVATYWYLETEKKEIVWLQAEENGPITRVWADEVKDLKEMDKAGWVKGRRVYEDKTVYRCVTNGLEILEKTALENTRTGRKVRSLPIVSCFGRVLYANDDGGGTKRKLLSLIRLARDPQQMLNYYRSAEAELVGMTPKFPYFVYRGSLNPKELELLTNSVQNPVAVIQIEPQVAGMEGPPPWPTRNPYEPPIQGLEIGSESTRRAIQSAIGSMPLPSQAQRQNEKSGKALDRITATAQKGSFHFIDHVEESITRVGELLLEYIPVFEDTAREVTIRKPDDSPTMVSINDPNKSQAVDVGKGTHDITLSTGPSFESQREEVDDFVSTLMSSPFAPRIADLAIRLKNLGPLGDEMADRLAPPGVVDPKKGPSPQQLMQQMQQLKQHADVLKQGLDIAVQKLNTKATEKQFDLQKAKFEADKELKLQQMRDATTLAAARIAAAAKIGMGIQEAEEEAIALAQGAAEQDQQHVHEHMQAEADREHEAQMAQLQHQQGMEQQDQAHSQALEQGQQAADLAPQPTEGEEQ